MGRGRGSPPVDSAAHAAALGSLEGADAVNLEADKPAPVYVAPDYGEATVESRAGNALLGRDMELHTANCVPSKFMC